MASTVQLKFPLDIEGHEQFMHFRISQGYKFRREQIEDDELYATVTLPLPANLNTAYAANYSSQELGLVGNMAGNNAEKIGGGMAGIMNSVASGDMSGAIDQLQKVSGDLMGTSDLKEIAGRLAKYYGPEIVKEAGTALGGAIGSTGGAIGTVAGAAIGKAVGDAVKGVQVGLGKARNPYLAAAFEGVGFKTHQFAFQLNPRNATESDTLAQIISAFRNAMLPGGKAIAQYYDYPKQFDIEFNDETYLFDIKTSVCTQFDVNYHGKGAYYHDINGKKAPVEVSISMAFMETTVRLGGDEKGASSTFKIQSPADKRLNRINAISDSLDDSARSITDSTINAIRKGVSG